MRLRFADCVLDFNARQLERHGRVVPLEPKVYELLEVLVQRRPGVVSNNELDELLWPQVYVARTSLTRLVSELRSALGDTPHASQIIRTVYKVGYAFCAEVSGAPGPTVTGATIELLWNRQSMPLADGEHVAGREGDCSVQVEGSTVSRNHARITVRSGAVSVEDLASTNGTFVNGTRIAEPTRLTPGDELRLGNEVLRVRRRAASDVTVKVTHDTRVDTK